MCNLNLSDLQKQMLKGKIYPYCKQPTRFVDSQVVYKWQSYGMIYHCAPCEAYVGVHKGTDEALGRLANYELREWKSNAHFWFDKIWRKEYMSRSEAYLWLSQKLNIPLEYTHIGMFGADTCKKVGKFAQALLDVLESRQVNKFIETLDLKTQ